MASSWATRFRGCAGGCATPRAPRCNNLRSLAPRRPVDAPRGCVSAHLLPFCAAQVHGFPFNLGISHPQYVGATLSLWGLAALLWAPLLRPTLLPVFSAWTGLYVFTGVIESRF
jgi:hypothetical protein